MNADGTAGTPDPDSTAAALVARALELGFDACRITTADPPESAPRLFEALAEGRHADMHWIARNAAKRADPRLVLPGARSLVTLAVSYHEGAVAPAVPDGQRPRGVVARYARRDDYHDRLKGPLVALSAWIDAAAGSGTRSLWYVDTGPILERDLAQRAGLGFVGRHTGLVSPSLGNWFLIAEILTTAVLRADSPARNRCGNCTRCLDACPTGALPAPFVLDSRRCISYLTIENKGPIPIEMRPMVGNRIFGCDDCLAVCPWNRFARESRLLRAGARPEFAAPELEEWLALDEAGFARQFAGTPMVRTKRRGLLRNVCVALGNVGDARAIPALSRAAADPEILVAEHARWAIEAIGTRAQSPGAPPA